MRIGVFDSGVGGLSVLAAIHQALPKSDLIYCCDNLNFPYGTKSDADVLACATQVAARLARVAAIDVLVVACNTASTIALVALRTHLAIPVVGVVPAIKPAARASKSKVIGVLATPATVTRPYLDQLIQDFAGDCDVVRVGSSRLVHLAEDKLRGKAVPEPVIFQEVTPIIDAAKRGLDQLVLGCTHFPLLSDELRRVIPSTVHFVDSGSAVASRVYSMASSEMRQTSVNTAESQEVRAPRITGFCTGAPLTLDLKFVGLDQLPILVLQPLP
jgi:glutamate racemase